MIYVFILLLCEMIHLLLWINEWICLLFCEMIHAVFVSTQLIYLIKLFEVVELILLYVHLLSSNSHSGFSHLPPRHDSRRRWRGQISVSDPWSAGTADYMATKWRIDRHKAPKVNGDDGLPNDIVPTSIGLWTHQYCTNRIFYHVNYRFSL